MLFHVVKKVMFEANILEDLGNFDFDQFRDFAYGLTIDANPDYWVFEDMTSADETLDGFYRGDYDEDSWTIGEGLGIEYVVTRLE